MALNEKELVQTSGSDIFATHPAVSQNEHITAIFGPSAGAENVVRCTPVGFNQATDMYGVWVAPDATSMVVTLTGATAGTWTVTADGVTTGDIEWDATVADVQSALLSIGYDVSVTLDAQVYTIVFDAAPQAVQVPTVTGTVTSITGGTPTAVATAGTSTYGLSSIVGFVWPDEVDLSATDEVHGEVMVSGRIDYNAIAATVATADVGALQTELKDNALARGIIVEQLPNIH